MANTWEAITGLVVFIVGAALFWNSYNYSASCNSIGGQFSTAISSMFGGNAAQICYNAGIIEVASIIAAIIGVVIIYAALRRHTASRSRR